MSLIGTMHNIIRLFSREKPFGLAAIANGPASPHDTGANVNVFLNTRADAAPIDKVVEKTDVGTLSDGKFCWSRRAYNFRKLLLKEVSKYFVTTID